MALNGYFGRKMDYMKKTFFLLLLTISICGMAAAQAVVITGTVQDNGGNLLHYAFIQDKNSKSGAYTDSLGHFSLQALPAAQLLVNCAGYNDAVIKINGQNNLVITLKPVAAGTNSTDSVPANTALQDALVKQMDLTNRNAVASDFQQGSAISIIHTKEVTQGSRYLFTGWVHGYVVNAQDSLVQNPAFLLNYDKVGGKLMLTKDRLSAIAVFQDKVKSFTLFDALNQSYTFTIVPDIDKNHYVQVLASGNSYRIYKSIKTKFEAANYESDGLASTGHNFDQYEDEFTYYILNVKTNQLQKISLKKKAIKQAFAADEKKTEEYFKTNDGDIDDNYLSSMGEYMNK